jgi:hypothetical protein
MRVEQMKQKLQQDLTKGYESDGRSRCSMSELRGAHAKREVLSRVWQQSPDAPVRW